MLANYLVSTGRFTHPVSRRPLTRADCERLDAHVRQHALGPASVAEVFDAQVLERERRERTSRERERLERKRERAEGGREGCVCV